jgi:hypothetical protein
VSPCRFVRTGNVRTRPPPADSADSSRGYPPLATQPGRETVSLAYAVHKIQFCVGANSHSVLIDPGSSTSPLPSWQTFHRDRSWSTQTFPPGLRIIIVQMPSCEPRVGPLLLIQASQIQSLMTDLGASFHDEYVRDWVLLPMYYDLMSLFAHRDARSISVGLTLLLVRTTVVAQLVNLLALADLASYHEILKIMTVIAKQVMPAPPPPPTQQQRAQRSRYSCAVMRTQPDGYLPPSSSDTEEEDEDNVDCQQTMRALRKVHWAMKRTPTRPTQHHNTRSSASARLDSEYVPHCLSQPRNRPAPASMMSPLGKRNSLVMHDKLRSPQTVIR